MEIIAKITFFSYFLILFFCQSNKKPLRAGECNVAGNGNDATHRHQQEFLIIKNIKQMANEYDY